MEGLRDLIDRGVGDAYSRSPAPKVEVEVEEEDEDGKEGEERVMIHISRLQRDEEGRGEVGADPDLDLWLVRYDPKTVEVNIAGGENAGRRLEYRNVVQSVKRVGFLGAEEGEGRFFVDVGRTANERNRGEEGRGGLVVLVQRGEGGEIMGAAAL